MTDQPYTQQLAQLCAPGLATLVHPGDETAGIKSFPLSLAMFQPAVMPEGMAREIADDMGMPTPDLNKHFLEAVLHLLAAAGATIRPKAEYDQLLAATSERKANEIQAFDYECGQEAWRVMVKKNNTTRPVVPCAVAAHDCKAGR